MLLAFRVLPRKPKNPERLELWHRKFGKLLKIVSPLLIVFGLWSLTTGLTDSDKEQHKKELMKRITVIRTQAGAPDKSGNYPAASTHGGYAVIFPAPFSELEMLPADNTKEQFTSYIMTSTFNDGKFTSIFMKYHGGAVDKTRRKDDAISRARTTPQVASVTEKNIAGNPALDIALTSPKQAALSRTIFADDGNFILSVEFAQGDEQVRLLAQKFFDSFRLLEPDKKGGKP